MSVAVCIACPTDENKDDKEEEEQEEEQEEQEEEEENQEQEEEGRCRTHSHAESAMAARGWQRRVQRVAAGDPRVTVLQCGWRALGAAGLEELAAALRGGGRARVQQLMLHGNGLGGGCASREGGGAEGDDVRDTRRG